MTPEELKSSDLKTKVECNHLDSNGFCWCDTYDDCPDCGKKI
mgnify:CR=1 FL=1